MAVAPPGRGAGTGGSTPVGLTVQGSTRPRSPAPAPQPRSRALYVRLLLLVVALGLASRAYRPHLPELIGRYAGDTLWATALLLTLALVWPRARTRILALAAAAGSLVVELSQLAHPPWLDALRQVPGVALLLGHDFVASDLTCYAAGVLVGAAIDTLASASWRQR